MSAVAVVTKHRAEGITYIQTVDAKLMGEVAVDRSSEKERAITTSSKRPSWQKVAKTLEFLV